GVLVSTALQMADAIGQYRASLATQRLAAADKAIFEAVLFLRSHRGDAQSMVLGDDDPRARLARLREAARTSDEQAAAALPRGHGPGRAGLAQALDQRWQAAYPQYQQLLDEAARPRAERDVRRTERWYNALTETIDAAKGASSAVSNQARMNDPFIAEM